MFAWRKNKDMETKSSIGTNIGMIVGKGTVFKGDVNVQELIRVDGTFEGDIKTAGKLVVGEPGDIKGNITAQEATIAGLFNGILKVSGKLELLSTARIYGDITTGSLVTSAGAIFNGTCAMTPPQEAAQNTFKPADTKSEAGKNKGA